MTKGLSNLLGKLATTASVIVIVGGLAGCATSPQTAEPVATATPVVCQPSSIQTASTGFSEIQGTMRSDGELWALLFFGQARVNEEVKIVWRITGTGEFVVEGRHEDGTVISPVWGPEAHEDSNWDRPGLEWGTGFTFPQAGCWTLTVGQGTTIGEIYLEVLPP